MWELTENNEEFCLEYIKNLVKESNGSEQIVKEILCIWVKIQKNTYYSVQHME